MSSLPRDRARASKSRGSEDEFVLFLQGVPARCRWQELKDLVRQTALHIRQAVVYDDHHGFPTGLGQIIVKNEDEAWRTYHRLSTNGWEGQSLVVTLARTSSPTRPVAGPTKSPPCIIQPSYVAGYSTPSRMSRKITVLPSPMSTEPVIPSSPTYHSTEYGTVLNPVFVSQPFMPTFTDPSCQPVSGVANSPTLQPSFCDTIGFGMIPPYAMSHQMHQPVIANSFRPSQLNTTPRKSLYNYNNPSQPTYPRHNLRRSIMIQNLNPTTTDQDLHTFLQDTVMVEHCQLLPLHTSPIVQPTRDRVSARVTLRSAEEAKHAVALYNNTFFKGFRIRVKFDKSTPPALSYNLASEKYTPWYSDISNRASHLQFTPPTTESSSSDTDELIQSHDAPQYDAAEPSPKSKPKPVDSCQPLVINGSGIGGRTAVAI
ncbi:hypothetical protein BDW62DRAFT_119241 [Aspergillus aurantiobrunneus]